MIAHSKPSPVAINPPARSITIVASPPLAPAPPPAKLLVTSKEAAALLSISERKLWDLGHSGQIPVVWIGKAKRYAIKDIEAWIERQKAPAD
jgi:predicted DNA-binding transcriptional regulator AlpA